jgi:c-di-GMP-binding flagellar brake protein YcgR
LRLANRNEKENGVGTGSGEDYSVATNEVLQVLIPDDPNPATYYSRVLSASKGSITMPWPTDRGIRLITHPGHLLDFYFIRSGTPHHFRGIVEKTDTGLVPQITVNVRGSAQQIQRRQDFRVKCLLPLEITYAVPQGKDGNLSAPMVIKTVTSDISAGGLSFRHAKRIPEGTLVSGKLSVPDDGPVIEISCRVIYSKYMSEHQTLYRTAVRYLTLSQMDLSRIVRFAYKIQLRGLRS